MTPAHFHPRHASMPARGIMLLGGLLALSTSGCMRLMGGGMFTVQHDGKLGAEARGALGIGAPQYVGEDVGVAGSIETAVGYDERAGVSGAFGPGIDYFIGGASPWSLNLGAFFQTRFSTVHPNLAFSIGLDLGVAYTVAETHTEVHMLNFGSTARYQWAMGFKPDPLQAGLFGFGVYYDSFHCLACQEDDIRFTPPD